MGNFLIGGTNIANIKIGGVQCNSVRMGTTGIWTNKQQINYTVTHKLTLEGNETANSSKYYDFGYGVYKSTGTTESFLISKFNGYADGELNINYVNPSTLLTDVSPTYTDTIYKSDVNKLKVLDTTFNYQYLPSNNIPQNLALSLDYLNSGHTATIITNGALTGSTTLTNTDLNLDVTLKQVGTPKINELTIYTETPVFAKMTVNGTYGVFVKFTCSIKVTSGTVDLESYSKFICGGGSLTLWGFDQYGQVFNADVWSVFNGDGINEYNYNSSTKILTLTQYVDLTGSFDVASAYDLTAEFNLDSNMVDGQIQISLNGQFDSNKMIYCYKNYEVQFNGYNESYTSFSAYNVEPMKATIKNYKCIIDYTLTDIYD